MGREVKRVAKDWSWPVGKVWEGYLNPHYESASRDCPDCEGSGSSPQGRALRDLWYGYAEFDPASKGSAPFLPSEPAIAALAARNAGASAGPAFEREARRLCSHYNGSWSHHLAQDEVDALVAEDRLFDFTKDFVPGSGWQPKPAGTPGPTAAQVNSWSLAGFGHDSINQWVVSRHVCAKNGWPTACAACGGEGTLWSSPEAKAECEAWEPTEPPAGPLWQVWETVSEGSPISPAFEDPVELSEWLARSRSGSVDEGTTAAQWLEFIVGPGWAPSMIGVGGKIVGGVQGSLLTG